MNTKMRLRFCVLVWLATLVATPAYAQLNGENLHRVWGFGPDVTMPIAAKSKLISLVNVRYFWETGAELKTQGQTLVVTATFPIPSVKIPPTQ